MKSLDERAADLLEAAGAVVWLPEWWTKNRWAADSLGRSCISSEADACAFCAIGALEAASAHQGLFFHARTALQNYVHRDVTVFNDHASSNEDVATAMFRAADALRGTK